MNQPIITLESVSYSYHSLQGEIPALENISFDVNNGEFLAIVGPSGCGKSTLLSIIAKLLEPEQGSISFRKNDNSKEGPKIGYMLQHDYLLEWRSIYKNVILGPEIKKQLDDMAKKRIEQMLIDYDLYKFKDKKPSELSGGMRQRAALIRTLALDPDILLLDEPFSALDYQTRLMVSDDICKIIRSTKKTAILITHDLSEAVSLADRVIVLSSRPAHVKAEISIHLTTTDKSSLAARKAPEFGIYFNRLWEELNDDKTNQNHEKNNK